MNISGVYQIKSTIKPSRIYIGSARDVFSRWMDHIRRLRKNKHHSIKLQRHYDKYGENDLSFSIVAVCDKKELIPINKIIRPEQFFIWAYNPYFNISPIAGSCMGVKRSKETKLKLREFRLGKKLSEEHRRNISISNKGVKRSEETKNKIRTNHVGCLGKSAWNKGLTKETDERVKKYSESATGKPHITITNELNKKQIDQYTKEEIFIQTWCSISDASRSLQIGRQNIISCLKKRLKSSGGYIWVYHDKE